MSDISLNEWPELYEPAFGESDKKYIFISYSHEDSDVVYQDLKNIADNGGRIWYDRAMHVGQNWVERARVRITDKNCAAVLFYVSPNSVRSDAFLRELELTVQRSENDPAFSYMSINIGEVTAFEILKHADIGEDAFLQILTAFNQRKLYIPRNENPLDQTHLLKLIDIFAEMKAIDISKCLINTTQLFEYAAYEQGLQITRYRGSDAIVTIPAALNGRKILAIGINAFKDNTGLKKVSIPEGIQVIDDFAFSGCRMLETISLPNSLLRLGYESFRDCCSLSEIIIPYHVEKIGDYCFYKCHNLSNIVLLSSSALRIEFAAFSECHALENLILPETTVFIGPYAFNNCINMGSIIIPKNVQQIGLSAFYNCASLKEVKINSHSVLKNNRWFARCRNLERVILRTDLKFQYLSDSSWNDCRDLLVYKLDTPVHVTYDTGVISWDSTDSADYYGIAVNGEKYESKRPFFILSLGEGSEDLSCVITAYSYDESIIASDPSAELVIHSNQKIFEVSNMEDGVVLTRYNGSESYVQIPNDVTEIGDEVFYNHEEIREVRFSDQLRKIGDRAFYHCLNLQKIKLPESLREIGKEAFWGAQIKELVLPQNVSEIGPACFACCNDLMNLYIRSDHMTAGDKAFYRCISLKKVELPKGFPELYSGMFRGCTELDDIVLPEGLRAIRAGSISYIMRLQRIIIPKSVTTIEKEAFSNSFGLMDIYVDESNPVYYDEKGVLFQKEDHKIIHYPADRKNTEYAVGEETSEIADYAFMDAEHLEKIFIRSGTKVIGSGAFERCPNLKEVIVDGDIDIIKKSAFKDCISLRKLYLGGSVVPEIQESIFDNVSAGFRIVVPEKYIKNYLRIIEWQKYHYLLYTESDVRTED